MRKFLIRFFIYLIPLPVYLGFVLIVDPFNYAGRSHLISDDTKTEIAERMNPYLWKLIEYKHDKSSRIILGDSRANKIQDYHVEEITGNDYYNLAYTGGTLADVIETFWIASKMVKLREVYLGISFNQYNGFETNNNVKQSSAILKNFFTYSFSKIVFTSSIKCVRKQFFTKNLTVGVPDMNKDEFWKYELDDVARRFYQKYKYPDGYHKDLIRIADYCRKNNIKLVFFIPPNHVDWQKRIADFNLEEQRQVFIRDIERMGILYNLDVVNDFTQNREKYFDPVHPVNDSLLVNTLWGKQPAAGKR
jgi:hypothetical protein